ncbi:hypothetical protein BRADI_3g19800v3 [Brachypodium distachyon]|uniref:Uncharacterized protein n=1 Tax=Brachypodium distachyon TaxID=15368 RepID=A0A0Q3I5T3_BRADI|nr:hypothetical protein BRADI_3g19800v3 [Brachypodium distachyon]
MTIPRSPGVTGFWALVRILSQYDQHQHETLIDLPEVAARLEQRIFVIAANLVDYNDKASKRLTYLETIVPHDRVKLRTSLFQLALPEKMEQKQPSRPQMIESSAEMLLRQSSSDEQNKINPARRNLPEVSSCGSRCRCTSKSILLTPSAVTLCDLSNAESIELSASVRQVAFDGVSTGRSMFINLRSLSLGEWCLSNNLSPILCFLRHSPLLEKLNLKLKLDCEKDEQTIQTARGISFAAEHLEKVTIYCTEGDARVPVLVNILRINARSLDRIDVKTY